MVCTTAVLKVDCWFRFCLKLGLFFVFCFWLFAFVVLGLVASVLSQEIGSEEHLRNDLFCVKWDVKP